MASPSIPGWTSAATRSGRRKRPRTTSRACGSVSGACIWRRRRTTPVSDARPVPDAPGLDGGARPAGTSVPALLARNPQYVRGVTPPGRNVVVRVPRGRGTLVAERFDSLPVTERITFVDHYVSRGQT